VRRHVAGDLPKVLIDGATGASRSPDAGRGPRVELRGLPLRVLRTIKAQGTYDVDTETEEGLHSEGWRFLERRPCGDAKPDRELPAASVSYVSALCGFLTVGVDIIDRRGACEERSRRFQAAWRRT
jgi:hypothetical protein